METLMGAKAGGYAATDADSAFKILFENKYHTCIIYDRDEYTLHIMVKSILNKIKDHNQTIPNINDQMLPSVYRWTAEDDNGDKCFYAAEINMGRFEEKAELLYIFNEPLYWVLSDPTARKPISSKAMKSLAMLGYMMTKEK